MQAALKAGTYEVRVASIVDETPDIRTFRLTLPPDADFDFLPGQFVMLSFPDEPKHARAYSLASSPLERGAFEITLNRVAKFTSRMFELRGGETLVARGPYGKWVYADDIAHAVLISGGTGVTPFRSMARYVLQKGLPNRLTLIGSSRTPSDWIYRRELEDLARRPRFKVVHTVTRPGLMRPGEDWDGPTGRITLELIRASVPDFSEAVYFLCGPNHLVEDLSRDLAAGGVAPGHIRREKWGDY